MGREGGGVEGGMRWMRGGRWVRGGSIFLPRTSYWYR